MKWQSFLAEIESENLQAQGYPVRDDKGECYTEINGIKSVHNMVRPPGQSVAHVKKGLAIRYIYL